MASRNDIQEYFCRYTKEKPALNGRLDGPWINAQSTAEFIDIRGIEFPKPRYSTLVKMMWDDDYLYVGAIMEEPHVWTNISKKNEVIYWQNDFEIFIDPDFDGENYYEFEINALGTIWELTLDKPYNKGGVATHPTNIPGLISAVEVRGTINDPSDIDEGWSVEVAIPWKGLERYGPKPTENDKWKMNFSRVEWKFEIKNGQYERIPKENSWEVHNEDNWVWSNQGEINMHKPENWGIVTFVS